MTFQYLLPSCNSSSLCPSLFLVSFPINETRRIRACAPLFSLSVVGSSLFRPFRMSQTIETTSGVFACVRSEVEAPVLVGDRRDIDRLLAHDGNNTSNNNDNSDSSSSNTPTTKIMRVQCINDMFPLCVAGLRDELIPPWHMRVLYNASPDVSGGGKRLFTVKDGTHNDTWERGGADYLKALAVFVDEVGRRSGMSALSTGTGCVRSV